MVINIINFHKMTKVKLKYITTVDMPYKIVATIFVERLKCNILNK